MDAAEVSAAQPPRIQIRCLCDLRISWRKNIFFTSKKGFDNSSAILRKENHSDYTPFKNGNVNISK